MMTIYQNTKKSITFNILTDIKKTIEAKSISLNKPIVSKKDLNSVKSSLLEIELSTYGKYTQKFEKDLTNFTKSNFVLCTNSGTTGLHLALMALDINNNDEVFLPAFNFVSSANAIKYCNATPHFLDIEKKNLGIDPIKLDEHIKKQFFFKNNKLINKKTKKHAKAIIIVYSYGHPPKIEALIKICKKYNIKIIEDAAEALGTYYKNKHAGTFGDIGIISFNGNKIITTGAGGAVLIKSAKIFKRIKDLATLAKKKNLLNINMFHITTGWQVLMLL